MTEIWGSLPTKSVSEHHRTVPSPFSACDRIDLSSVSVTHLWNQKLVKSHTWNCVPAIAGLHM